MWEYLGGHNGFKWGNAVAEHAWPPDETMWREAGMSSVSEGGEIGCRPTNPLPWRSLVNSVKLQDA